MKVWEIVLLFCGAGGGLVTLIKIIGDFWLYRRKRKDDLEDREAEKMDKNESLQTQFIKFRDEQKKENMEVRRRLSGVESTLEKLCENTAAGEYIEIRREALGYIRHGEVDSEDWALLKDRHARYKSISNDDESLDKIMAEVDKLRKT